MTATEWADKHFYLSEESSSIHGPWKTLPYQKAILNAMGNDDLPVVTFMKAARVGYTKCFMAAVGYNIEHRKRNQLIYQPTDSDAESFVKDEIDPMLRDCKPVSVLLKSDPEKRNKNNTNDKKVFTGSILDIKGGKSPKNYRRMTKDFVAYDELDGFDLDIGGETGQGEGDAISLGDTRLETSSFPKSVRGSTPKVKGTSQIEASFEEADLQMRRFLPCPHCGHEQALQWRQVRWENNDYRSAHYECIECQERITYSQYAEMDRHGRWQHCEIDKDGIAQGLGIYLDDDDLCLRTSDGQYYPPVHHIGFHIWSAYSYFMAWSELVREWFAAQKSLEQGKIKLLKSFTNLRLGETWAEEGEEADEKALKQHREPYAFDVPDGVKVLTAGVDIQDDRFECEIVGWGDGEERWSIDYVVMHGKMDKPEIWNILDETLNRQFEGPGGELFDIKLTCIDSGGHYTDEVYTFCERRPLKYIPTKGHALAGKPIASFPAKKNARGLYFTMVGSDTAKELIYERYKTEDPGPGYCHYPTSDVYDDKFFEQACSETKFLKYRKGVPYYEWVKDNATRNEVLDCGVENLAAIRILQQYFGVRLKTRTYGANPVDPKPATQPETQEPAEDDAPAINSIRRKARFRRNKSGFVNKWRR